MSNKVRCGSISIIGLLLGLIMSFSAYSQIKGSVQDAHTEEKLEGCTLRLLGKPYGMVTDSAGKFFIPQAQTGDIVEFKYIGYRTHRHTIKAISEELSVSLEPLGDDFKTNAVVITGLTQELRRSESPIPIEVYSARYFLRNPVPSLFEAMRSVNGVQPQLNCNVCNTGDIHINGMEGPYTLILIDGAPIVSGLATVYGLSGLPTALIERVEVVKGPAATLYGSEAVGGLINIITKSAKDAPRLTLDLMATTWAEYSLDAGIKINLNKASSLLSLQYFDFQNRIDKNQDNFTDMALQRRISVFNKWQIPTKNNKALSFSIRGVYENRFGGEMNWTQEYRGTDSIYGESIFTRRVEVVASYPFTTALTAQASYSYHYQDAFYGTIPYSGIQHIAFGQLVWNHNFGRRNSFSCGSTFRFTSLIDNTSISLGIGMDSLNYRPILNYLPGVFVQNEYAITEKHRLLAGLRYDYHTTHGNIISPRLNYKWTITANNIVRIGAGNGFRVVNVFTEDHAALTGARTVIFKENLKPERSWNININYQKQLQAKFGAINIDISGFYNYFENKIIADLLTSPNEIIYENLRGYAVTRGFALNTNFFFSNGIKLMLGTTLMQAYEMDKDELGNQTYLPQLQAPNFSHVFTLSVPIDKLKITLDYTGTIYSPMPLPILPNDFRPEYSPWFSLQNIQLTKDFKNGLQVYGGIKNLLNFIPQDPIMRPFDPFDKTVQFENGIPVPSPNNPNAYTFDPTYNYAPMQGIRGYLGLRWSLFRFSN